MKGFEVVLDEVLARTGFYDDTDNDNDSILDDDDDDGMLLIDDLKS